ncbi:MAG: HD domain-containing protein [Clostridia bacterium]|nr:HD domain-containing protein [Clostridia bacterium]
MNRSFFKIHFRGILRRSAIFVLAAAAVFGLIPTAAMNVGAVTAVDTSGKGAGFSSILYDGTSGLPTSEANAIVQTSDGFIWIGGYSGLIRYDGNEFYRYDSSDGIASVVCLFADSKGRLWIGTNDNGVAMLCDGVFTFFNRVDGLNSSSIRSIVEDPDGNIIVATTMGLCYIDDENSLHVINDPQLNREYICELVGSKNGTIYGVTLSGAYFTLKARRVTGFYSSEDLGRGTVNTIYPDPADREYVYLGTQGSDILHLKLDGSGEVEVYSAEPQSTINAIRLIDGYLWICADNGIGFFDQDFNYVRVQDLPMTNSIDHIMVDYEQNLWFTSSRQGVMKIVENRFTDVFALAKLPSAVVNTTCRDGGLLYIGTDSGLVILDENYEKVENELTSALEGARIRCIRRDGGGDIWLCTYGANALVRYDPSDGTIVHFTEEDGIASNRVRMLKPLSDGSIAVATNSGLNILEDGKITATYGSSHGISNLEILCVEEASDGRILFGSDGDGIYVLEGTRISRIGIDDGLMSEVILRIIKDSLDDLYWIITSNSIAYLKGDKVTTVTQFPYSNNFDLYFDHSGRMWVLASNGVYVVNRSDMISNSIKDFILFDTKCGLPGISTANSYSHLDPDGTLWISASNGVSRVNIDADPDDFGEVRLSVPFVYSDDSYVPVGADMTVHIPADCKRLNICANAFTYSLNNPHLSYCLEGFDEQPIEVTKQELGLISYTNLDGGTYRFHLSIINTLTGEPQQTVTVTVVKDMAFYETLWFLISAVALAILIVAGVIVLYFRHKTKLLLKKQEEHKKLINEMTKAFAKCVDGKDAYTNGHSLRVAEYTALIAKKLGKSRDEIDQIYNIALLHDIGKISIPDNILNKPGRLTDEEFAIMKSHSRRGFDILKDITIAPELALGAGYHHERYDGKGYPAGLSGDRIPEVAQIIAVADCFDAMYSNRPYRKQLEIGVVMDEIKRASGSQLNPKIVDAFEELLKEGKLEGIDRMSVFPDWKIDRNDGGSDGGSVQGS